MEFGEIMSYVGTAIGSGVLTQVANWKLNKRKEVAAVKSDEIDNLRKTMADFYEPLVRKQNERIGELEEEVKTLREQLNYERNEHQKQIQNLQKQIVEIARAVGIQSNRRVRDERTGRYAKKEEK